VKECGGFFGTPGGADGPTQTVKRGSFIQARTSTSGASSEFAVTIKLQRVLRLDDLGSSAPGDDVRKACLEENDLAASVDVATHLGKAGIQGLIFPSVVKGGDDNLIVYVANCDPGALQIQNEDEFVQEAKKLVTKRR
jgi:hypothetical protein